MLGAPPAQLHSCLTPPPQQAWAAGRAAALGVRGRAAHAWRREGEGRWGKGRAADERGRLRARGGGAHGAARCGRARMFRLPVESDTAFEALNLSLVGWVLLAFAPRWRRTPAITLAIAAASSVLYVCLAVEGVLGGAGTQPEGAGFGSLQAVSALFSKERNVLAGWTHYIAYGASERASRR